MKLIAKSVYFVPLTDEFVAVQISSFQRRLWLKYESRFLSICDRAHDAFSAVAVHTGVVTLLLVALIGGFIQIVHGRSRKNLHLHHQPGTIASAVSIGAQSQLATLLNGQQEEGAIWQALRNKKFRIHPETNQILVQGEIGYDEAVTPDPRQAFFQSTRSR